jgi:tetratricopeptide (TPR) repeat protein
MVMSDKAAIEALVREGVEALDRKDWDEALAAFERAAAADPADWRLPNEVGNCLLRLNRFAEAAPAFRRALAVAPADKRSFVEFNEALALAQSGRTDEAIDVHRRILERDPSYEKSHAELGTLLRQKGDGKAALAHLDKAVDALHRHTEDPNRGHHLGLCYLNRARIQLFMLGDEDAGVEQAELLLDETRELGKAWKLSTELCDAGKWTAARRVLELILEIDPGGREPRQLLERVERELERS